MKKLLSLLLVFLMLIPMIFSASAKEPVNENQYFEDGSYISVTYEKPEVPGDEDITQEAQDSPGVLIRFLRQLRKIFSFILGESITKTKYVSYYDNRGTLLWCVYLSAEFTYNGLFSYCRTSRLDRAVYDSDWKLVQGESYEKGDTAFGSFTMQQYKLGVPLRAISEEISLTCDKKGNIK